MITSHLNPENQIPKEALYPASQNPSRSWLPALPSSPRPVRIALSLFPAHPDQFSSPRIPNTTRLASSKMESPRIILSTFRTEHHKILEESAPQNSRTGKYLPADFFTQVERAKAPNITRPKQRRGTRNLKRKSLASQTSGLKSPRGTSQNFKPSVQRGQKAALQTQVGNRRVPPFFNVSSSNDIA